MSKRKEHPEEVSEQVGQAVEQEGEQEKAKQCPVEAERDARFVAKLEEWTKLQPVVRDALRVVAVPAGIISLPLVVKNSLLAHKGDMEKQGYKYYEKAYDLSCFELCMRERFDPAMDAGENIANVVLDQLHAVLSNINDGSKPVKNRFSMLVMMDTKYIKPVADMIGLVQSPYSVVEDLDLVWELLERIWCFGHPVFRHQTSRNLDFVCQKITERKREVDEA